MRDLGKVILITHLLVYITIGFNIPILRQIAWFFYLMFVPGLVILRILKLESRRIDLVLFSVGLSVAFLMFVGLFMCTVYRIFGVSKPLSTIPLMITLSGVTLALFIIGYRQDLATSINMNSVSELKKKSNLYQAIFLVFLPLLSIVGAMWDNTFILLVVIIAIAILYGLSTWSKIVSTKLYLLMIFAISAALLFHTSMISRYIMGGDIHLETYCFRSIETKGYWSPPGVGVYSETARFESVLSITILPTIYSVLLNASSELIFKVIYPLIFCLVPLALYRMYETQGGKLAALLSTFFFVSHKQSFFGPEPLSLGKQMIGMFFLVLSIFLLVEKTIPVQKKRVLFIVFGAALVVSHYAISYFYIFMVTFTFVFLRKWRARNRDLLSAVSVLFLFAMTFSWYLYVSDAPLVKLNNDGRRVYNNFMTDLFNPQARSPQLPTLTSPPTSIVSLVYRVVFYIENLFIVIGIITLFRRDKKQEFDPTYRLMSIMSMTVLILCLGVPYFAQSFQLTRFYAITIIFLAPFFVLGGEVTFNRVKKEVTPFIPSFSYKSGSSSHRKLALQLVSVVLIASFLFNTGFVDHIAGTFPESISLDHDRRRTSNYVSMRNSFYYFFLLDQDVSSAVWLSKYGSKTSWVYADTDSRYLVLLSYGLIPLDQSVPLFVYPTAEHAGYAYLRSMNVVEGLVANPTLSNLSDISSALDSSNRIYSNGASEIYSPLS